MYYFLSAVALLISAYLFKRAAGTLSPLKLNMVSWIFYVEFLLQAFFSSVLTVNNLDDHYMVNKISDPNARLYGYYAITYTLVAFPFGMVLANNLFKFNPKKQFAKYTSKPIIGLLSSRDSFLRFPLYGLSIICMLSTFYVFYVIRDFPLLKMISGSDSILLSTLRQDASREFHGNVYVRNILGLMLTPILCYISYGYYRKSKSFGDLFWFSIMLLLSVLVLTYNLEKAPVIYFFLGFLFFWVLEKGQIKGKVLFVAGLAVLAILIALYSMLGFSDLSLLFHYRYGILGRVLLSQPAGVYLSFDTFPQYHDFVGFRSMGQLADVLGIESSDRSARILMERYNPAGIEAGTAGVMNSLFIGEAWANFGFFGVCFFPIYVGFLVQCMYVFFLKSRKTPLLLGFFTYFSYKGGINGGINEYIYHPVLIAIVVLIFIIYLLSLHMKSSHKHERKNHISPTVQARS